MDCGSTDHKTSYVCLFETLKQRGTWGLFFSQLSLKLVWQQFVQALSAGVMQVNVFGRQHYNLFLGQALGEFLIHQSSWLEVCAPSCSFESLYFPVLCGSNLSEQPCHKNTTEPESATLIKAAIGLTNMLT